ncbi:MAG: hypothetical protein ACE5HJ_08495 [Thermoplasmata archaeon]
MAISAEARPSRLYTSNRVLDDFLGGFEPAKLTFLNSGSGFVHDLVFQLCVRHILDFDRDVVYVDGGNSINPYTIASIAKRYGKPRQDMLTRIRVARAFTAYQMAALLIESLEDEVRAGPGLLVLSRLPDLFLDEDVEYQEAYHLLRRGLRKVRELVREEEIIGLVTNHGLSQLSRRRGVGNLLHQMADMVVRIRSIKGGLLISLPKEGRSMPFLPVPPNQAILEDYITVGPSLEAMRAPSLRTVGKEMGHQTGQIEISAFC